MRPGRSNSPVLYLFFLIFVATEASAQESPSVADEDTSIVHYDRKLGVRTPDGRFGASGKVRLQGRLTTREMADVAEQELGVERARLGVEATAFDELLGFELEVDVADGLDVKDLVLEYRAHELARIWIGKFKRPFSRQHMTSDSRYEFVDSAVTDGPFGTTRSIGAEVYSGLDQTLDYLVAVFVDDGGAQVARLGYNYGGLKGYREPDLEGGPLRFGLGVNAMVTGSFDQEMATKPNGGIDWIVKYHHLSLGGEALASMLDGELDGWGFRQQIGYAFHGFLQPALRFALVDTRSEGRTEEWSAALSLYVVEHRLKLQSDVSRLERDTTARMAAEIDVPVENRGRLQLQVVF